MKFRVLFLAICVGLTAACEPINFSLGPSSSTRGQVISDDLYLPAGEGVSIPVAGVRVEVVDGPEKGRVSITNSDGRYDLGSLTTNARVIATKDGWEPAHWMWLDSRLWDVLSQEPHVMWGSVRVGNTTTPLDGVRIEILDGPNAGKVTQTNAAGEYRFRDLVTSPRFNVELSKTSYQTRRVFVDNFNLCEWGTTPCGLRRNLQFHFILLPSPGSNR